MRAHVAGRAAGRQDRAGASMSTSAEPDAGRAARALRAQGVRRGVPHPRGRGGVGPGHRLRDGRGRQRRAAAGLRGPGGTRRDGEPAASAPPRSGARQFAPPTILRRLVAQGRLGVKTGQGFFPYPRPDAGWEERPVKLESRGDVAIAWLDRPPANSLAPEVLDTMSELWEQVTASDAIRVLVFASANPMLFCAGADIKAFQRLDATTCRDLVRQRPRAVRRLRGRSDGDDRRRQRGRAGRRLRAGHGLRPAHRRRFGQLRPARDQPRDHPRLRRAPNVCRAWSAAPGRSSST